MGQRLARFLGVVRWSAWAVSVAALVLAACFVPYLVLVGARSASGWLARHGVPVPTWAMLIVIGGPLLVVVGNVLDGENRTPAALARWRDLARRHAAQQKGADPVRPTPRRRWRSPLR